MTSSSRARQQGATLFVALIMLLIVTLLAISSLREVILESRMTANSLEAKRLTSAAEAGLRAGEGTINTAVTVPEASDTCTSESCVRYASAEIADDYTSPRFASGDTKADYAPADNTTFDTDSRDTTIQWYAVPAGTTCVEDNCALTGKGGAFFFAVNSCAGSCTTTDGSSQRVTLRSVLAKVFN
ncbi:pilus assembly PilX family protein [Pseudomonas sp. MT3]|nr:PilX N-terminal domain-containing pilus assembly protein [uncultured Pseudomonas sp.]